MSNKKIKQELSVEINPEVKDTFKKVSNNFVKVQELLKENSELLIKVSQGSLEIV
jgi:hypothetical protein